MLAPSLEVLRWLQALHLSYELHLVKRNFLIGLEADKCHQEYHLHHQKNHRLVDPLYHQEHHLFVDRFHSLHFSLTLNGSSSSWNEKLLLHGEFVTA